MNVCGHYFASNVRLKTRPGAVFARKFTPKACLPQNSLLSVHLPVTRFYLLNTP